MRASIVRRLDTLKNESGELINRISETLKRKLAEGGVDAWVNGRAKRPYSIWRKMEEKRVTFEQLADIYGLRVVVGSLEGCYQALGVIHRSWRHVPGRFKDYISLPKTNGYRSLHTAVFGPENERIELQIRTSEMHDIAERRGSRHIGRTRTNYTGTVRGPIRTPMNRCGR